MKISYCLLTLNRKEELQRAIRQVAPWVERTIVIDGYSTDGTKEWLDSQECKDLHVEYQQIKQQLYQYGNHNPKKRNPYLELAGTDGWILVTDTDEFLEQDTCENLQSLIERAETEGFNGIKFMPHDIWQMADGTIRNIRHEDYWTPMLFKAAPGQHYEGHTHVRVVRPDVEEKWMLTLFYYQHIKDEARIIRNSTQNYWTTVGLAQNNTNDYDWLCFHAMMRRYHYFDWHEFDKVMTSGIVPKEIKQWFIDHKDAKNDEERSWYTWYFTFLHPEQLVSND